MEHEVYNQVLNRNQGRTWFITINGTKIWEDEFAKSRVSCLYAIGQVEVGEDCGREHMHMLVHFKTN